MEEDEPGEKGRQSWAHAKKFGLYFRTGGGWKDWEWLPSLGPISRESRNFVIKLVRPPSTKEMSERPTPRKHALILTADKHCAFCFQTLLMYNACY